MFSTIKPVLLAAVAVAFINGSAEAQSSRSEALRQAQARGQQAISSSSSGPRIAAAPRIAQGSGARIPSPVINNPIGGAPVISNPVGGAPVITSPPIGSPIVGGAPGFVSPNQGGIIDGGFVDGGSPIIGDAYFDGGIVQGAAGCGPGCPPNRLGCGLGYAPYCLFNWIGRLFTNAEIVGGAHAFRSQNFTAGSDALPDGLSTIDDSSFGFFGGLNFGTPIPLTGGLLSGQIGIRSSQSEFGGDIFSIDNRDQLFATGALFRRVDNGLQFGVAFDFLHEEWFTETDLAQVRGDISWVCPGGRAIGFRFNVGVDDDETSGIINGVAFDDLFAQVIDNFRAYYRLSANRGGYCDLFAGWSDSDQAVLGIDFDMPVSGGLGLQAGFVYFLPEDTAPNIPTTNADAWNLSVGFAWRPQGPRWYRNYHRPFFNVADNGTFVFARN